MKIILVRHGQAQHTVDYIYRGLEAYYDPKNTDPELTTMGISQAKAIQLKGKIDVIFCSPLKRCRQTLCNSIQDFNGIKVFLDDRLMEPQGELYCNKRIEKDVIEKESPAGWNLDGVACENPFKLQKEGHNQHDARFKSRVLEMGNEILEKHSNKTIVIFTQHDWISEWFRTFMNIDISPRYGEILHTEVL
jgi:alpha-ribazole phosphatase